MNYFFADIFIIPAFKPHKPTFENYIITTRCSEIFPTVSIRKLSRNFKPYRFLGPDSGSQLPLKSYHCYLFVHSRAENTLTISLIILAEAESAVNYTRKWTLGSRCVHINSQTKQIGFCATYIGFRCLFAWFISFVGTKRTSKM